MGSMRPCFAFAINAGDFSSPRLSRHWPFKPALSIVRLGFEMQDSYRPSQAFLDQIHNDTIYLPK